jgi:hypothetical protein
MNNPDNPKLETEEIEKQDKIPSLTKLVLCMVYELMLLFGIVFITGLIYGIIFQQKHALHDRAGLQISIFTILGIYFITCWHRTGQTLAMKTWHLQLKDEISQSIKLSLAKATIRYILCCMVWVMPAILVSYIVSIPKLDLPLIISNVVLVFLLAKFSPYKQFIHDKFLGIKFIDIK